MRQNERLDYLIREYLKENEEYRDTKIPETEAEKRKLLRTLMSVRPAKEMDPKMLEVQNEYLSGIVLEKGIVNPEDIPTVFEIGSVHPFAGKLAIWKGDITRLACDAIVNSRDPWMTGSTDPNHLSVDNSIQTYAGAELRLAFAEESAKQKERFGEDCEQPLLTRAYNLPASHVIHIAGPKVSGEVTEDECNALADCYRNVLEMCREHGFRTVAFPCISAGHSRFPKQQAAETAVNTVTEWLRGHRSDIDLVIFDVFTDEDRTYYEDELYRTSNDS